MTPGRSPYADEFDTPRYGPDGPPSYDPPATPTRYGPTDHGTTWLASADPGTAWLPVDDDAGADWSPTRIESVPVAPRRRGQRFSWVVLVLAVAASGTLGVCLYRGLATVRISAPDPWTTAGFWLVVCALAAVAAAGVFLLAIIALVVSRPKLVAGVAMTAAFVLPLVALYFGLSLGIAVATHNAELDAGAVVNLVDTGLDGLGIDAGPVRPVLDSVARVVAGQG